MGRDVRAREAACGTCSRRGFVRAVATMGATVGVGSALAPLLAACGGDGGGSTGIDPNALPAGVVRDGGTLRVTLAAVPALGAVGGALAVPAARVLVTRPAADDWRAFDATCPHAGSTVTNVEGQRLVCPAHSSAFDLTGRVVRGPAESGLRALPVRVDRTSGTLTVTLG